MSSLDEELHALLIQKNLTLGLAESITGGLLSYRLVKMPDCSAYLKGSIVAYSNEAKVSLLGVRSETLDAFGAVSENVAKEMAIGALKAFESDFALAVTGIAGPKGATPKKSVGTVFFALSSKKKVLSWTEQLSGSRSEIIEKTTTSSLQHLLLELINS